MSWIHDNKIKSYNIDLEKNTLTLYTEYKCKDIEKETTISFKNVIASEFYNIGSSCTNILDDIEVNDIDKFIEEYNDLLVERKNYCWPLNYKDIENLKDILKVKKQKYYEINPVCGIYGFILAEKMTITINGEIKEEN